MIPQEIDLATGLSAVELSNVFENNPRAYMAVRGAVAEKHLEKVLNELINIGEIIDIQPASGDLDKDFYLNVGGRTLSLECKNVEVAKITTKPAICDYLSYLNDNGLIELNETLTELGIEETELTRLSLGDLKSIIQSLPQKYRESGITRYQFSASNVENPSVGSIRPMEFLEQFHSNVLTIDFKRTRNSTDETGNTRRNRFYKSDEIDLVAACLFSRTMEWKFLYAKAENFKRHDQYPERYSDKLVLEPGIWTDNLVELIRT
ncbi:hypothetical protein FAP94_14990 [Morganella morganii]|nr:hypothetical protein [Morganella morganii]